MAKTKPASPFPNPDFIPGFDVLWETEVTHDIKFRGASFKDSSLILKHRYEGGITCFDPASRSETWEFRLNDPDLRIAGEAGDCLLVSSYLGVHAVKRDSGEAAALQGIGYRDRFQYFTGTHAIFGNMQPGAVVVDMATREVMRYARDLEPCLGFGDAFVARDPGTRSAVRYIGRHETGTGRLLKSNARPLALPETEPRVLYPQGPAGFIVASPGDRAKCRLWIYSWSGDLLRELALEEPGVDFNGGLSVELIAAADGSLDRLLVIVGGVTGSRVILYSLIGPGSRLWSREAKGMRREGPVIAGNRLIWTDHDFYVKEDHIARSMDLATGESGVFLDEPISDYLTTDGRGIFFGRGKQGSRHLAYGIFAPAANAMCLG